MGKNQQYKRIRFLQLSLVDRLKIKLKCEVFCKAYWQGVKEQRKIAWFLFKINRVIKQFEADAKRKGVKNE